MGPSWNILVIFTDKVKSKRPVFLEKNKKVIKKIIKETKELQLLFFIKRSTQSKEHQVLFFKVIHDSSQSVNPNSQIVL